jgi:hypothetical protein
MLSLPMCADSSIYSLPATLEARLHAVFCCFLLFRGEQLFFIYLCQA